jgi:hypothetical protein
MLNWLEAYGVFMRMPFALGQPAKIVLVAAQHLT